MADLVYCWLSADLFSTYFSVQVSVAINNWRRPFFDAVQNALSDDSTTTAADLYSLILIFLNRVYLDICLCSDPLLCVSLRLSVAYSDE